MSKYTSLHVDTRIYRGAQGIVKNEIKIIVVYDKRNYSHVAWSNVDDMYIMY